MSDLLNLLIPEQRMAALKTIVKLYALLCTMKARLPLLQAYHLPLLENIRHPLGDGRSKEDNYYLIKREPSGAK